MASTTTPTRATIFSYQVGFGDCFLLRFGYPAGRARHVLIDFGSTGLPDGTADDHMLAIARDVRDKCGGKLDVVVATHRHADHISGFATRPDGTGPGDIIRQLEPEVVLQPWTEAPDAPVDGRSFPGDSTAMAVHRRQLAGVQRAARQVIGLLQGTALGRVPPALRQQLAFIGQDNLSNAAAIENLMTMGKTRVYGFHGSNPGLARVLPGVTTLVLGPPTLKQSAAIRKQRRTDPDEFWQLGLAALDAAQPFGGKDGTELFPGHPTRRGTKLPRQARWFAHRVDLARGEQLLSLVRALDKQMNNTSLILLFEAAGKKLLFPGDAQIENWQYALGKPDIVSRLADVDVYKVGHHGSLNATPRSLWNEFRKRRKGSGPKPLKSILSTMAGKHGHADSDTEVPRETLVTALAAETELHSTQSLSPSQLCSEVTIPLDGVAAQPRAARRPAASPRRPPGGAKGSRRSKG
jgi:glyoxylase-like metal-dependent hydrolase (beta-lactamase superfamily II)